MPLNVPPTASPVPAALLEGFMVERVLYEAEAPVVFVGSTTAGLSLLGYLADESEGARWILFAPCSPELEHNLCRGRITVREAITSSWLWLSRFAAAEDTPEETWAVHETDLPDEHLPAPGTPIG